MMLENQHDKTRDGQVRDRHEQLNVVPEMNSQLRMNGYLRLKL
ncbi:MAG: hypothetical protein V7735_22675 [Photobacterium frigidiphilum]